MTQPTKNESDVKESSSQEIEDDVTNDGTPKDMNTIMKNFIDNKSSRMQAFTEQAVNDIKNVQESYLEKEEKVLGLLTFKNTNQRLSEEYEEILQDNISRLKDIAQEDFKTSYAHSQTLIEETKSKIHAFISKTFKAHSPKKDFTKTAGAIFQGVHKKLRNDMNLESTNVMRTTGSLSPDYGQIFVHNVKKPPEEIEAERLLQDLFEQQLLAFNEQITKDFQDINSLVVNKVEDTKTKVNETIQGVKDGTKIPAMPSLPTTDTSSIPYLPPVTQVEENVSELLNKAGKDFRHINECMLNDVTRNKQKINENVKNYAEKFLGAIPKRFPFRSEEEE